MQKITKETKMIADAHLLAKQTGLFNDPVVSDKDQLLQALKQGQTFSKLMDDIEIRFVSVTSLMMAQILDHNSEAYKKGIYKGFKQLLQN
jgi:hypothetical protein